MTRRPVLLALFFIQAVCAFFFIFEILTSIFGITAAPINWQVYEIIQIGATVGLTLGLLMGAVALNRTLRRSEEVEEQLRVASGAFHELIEERFADWGLTPAERDVALFAVKGLSTQEIASLRDSSEGTVKAQTAAIYRKAGVSGRPQLLSLFIEDLMEGPLTERNGQSGKGEAE